jgi:hypothetical protein
MGQADRELGGGFPDQAVGQAQRVQDRLPGPVAESRICAHGSIEGGAVGEGAGPVSAEARDGGARGMTAERRVDRGITAWVKEHAAGKRVAEGIGAIHIDFVTVISENTQVGGRVGPPASQGVGHLRDPSQIVIGNAVDFPSGASDPLQQAAGAIWDHCNR